MQRDQFIKEIAAEFEHEKNITAETKFQQLKSWDSMHALIVIARIDELCNVMLSADDLKKATTIQDLYEMVIHQKK